MHSFADWLTDERLDDAIRFWTCPEPEFRLYCVKLSSHHSGTDLFGWLIHIWLAVIVLLGRGIETTTVVGYYSSYFSENTYCTNSHIIYTKFIFSVKSNCQIPYRLMSYFPSSQSTFQFRMSVRKKLTKLVMHMYGFLLML